MSPSTLAAVWHGGRRVELVRLALPAPGPGEVLVRVRLATVCGSDLHTVSGARPAPCPSILGHEAVGEVVAVGAGFEGPAAVGDRVVWGVTVSCGRCDRCTAGRTAKCRRVRKVGHESFESSWPLSGGYAEHVLLPRGATVVQVPAELSDVVAAPAACATATVVAAIEAAGPLTGRRVLVSGAGMLGLAAVAAAQAGGAAVVVASDVDPARLDLARRFGATETILAGAALPRVDIAVELSGAPAAVTLASDALDVGGRLVLAGSVSPGPPLVLDPERMVRDWLTVCGVHNYEPHHLNSALDLLVATRHLPWAELVSAPTPLGDIGRLLHDTGRTRPRAAVAPGQPATGA